MNGIIVLNLISLVLIRPINEQINLDGGDEEGGNIPSLLVHSCEQDFPLELRSRTDGLS